MVWPFAFALSLFLLPIGLLAGFVVRDLLWPPVPWGCCRRCGYDLRATPDRCPECGTERIGAG